MKVPQSNLKKEWDRTVSILGNPLVMRDILKVFGYAFLALWLCLEIMSWLMKTSMTLYVLRHPQAVLKEAQFAIGFVALIAVISVFAVAIVFRGGYKASFGVNESGAWMKPQPDQRTTNDRIHMLLFGMGVVAGNPGAAGTALIAEATQDKAVSWSDIHKVVPYPARQAVALHDSWHCALILYCRPEDYDDVLQFAQNQIGKTAE
jgi:hypothetical protein